MLHGGRGPGPGRPQGGEGGPGVPPPGTRAGAVRAGGGRPVGAGGQRLPRRPRAVVELRVGRAGADRARGALTTGRATGAPSGR
ncbi:MAG: hypothetical protein C0501_30375 [Isosphaera sp.]|nr:hypothetical protein [Isosphaera sp.]